MTLALHTAHATTVYSDEAHWCPCCHRDSYVWVNRGGVTRCRECDERGGDELTRSLAGRA